MKTTFIYALCEPDTGEIRYIGKADDPDKRLGQHLTDKSGNHRTNWIKSLIKKGKYPRLEIIDEVPSAHWQQIEVAYIEFFAEQGAILTNGTLGGEGCAGTPETCEKISKTLMGHPGLPGSSNPFFGKTHTEESREKIRNARKKQISPWKGKTFPPEMRAKMSAAATLRCARERQEKILAEMWR